MSFVDGRWYLEGNAINNIRITINIRARYNTVDSYFQLMIALFTEYEKV